MDEGTLSTFSVKERREKKKAREAGGKSKAQGMGVAWCAKQAQHPSPHPAPLELAVNSQL